jgi:hypothetical protein
MTETTITSITQYDPRLSLAAFASELLAVGNVVVFDGNGKWALPIEDETDTAKLTVPLLIGCTLAEATAGGQPAFLTGITKGKGKLAAQLTAGGLVYAVADANAAHKGMVTDNIDEAGYTVGVTAYVPVIGMALPNKGILIDTHVQRVLDTPGV